MFARGSEVEEDGRASAAAAPCHPRCGKMAEEQASGAASLAGDDDWDAGELTRTMAAHGQRPAAGRHAPRLSVPTRAAAAVLLGLHLHLDLHAHAAGGGGEAAPEAEEVVERGAVGWI